MPDTSTEPKPHSSTTSETSLPSTENVTVAFTKSQAVTVCAAGLLICFFLPWISFLGGHSGMTIAKEGGKATWLWLIPICSGVTLIAGLTNQSVRVAAQLTGALPFAALAVALYHNGSDLFKILAFGAWISLILGLVLFIIPRGSK